MEGKVGPQAPEDAGGEGLSVSWEEGVLCLTLHRSHRRNALTASLSRRLGEALAQARDPKVRAVLLTGSGGAFCSGLDLRSVEEAYARPEPPPLGEWVRRDFGPLVAAMVSLPKPVVAAVEGVAAGAGLGLALAADVRVVDEHTRFVLAFPGVAVGPDSGVSYFLPRLVGLGRAWELLVREAPVGGREAVAMGLAQELAPPGEVVPYARALAHRLAQGPTVAYGLFKRALHRGVSADLGAALEEEARLQEEAARTEDHREAVRAFLERRPPTFRGR
jgi:2-(1,2-epoxy-1,2-dihydrophenyl)acetyl-CoA isomerase